MLKFVGDICLTDIHLDIGCGIGTKIKNGFNPFEKLNKQEDEIWIGNFESVVATHSIHMNYHRDFFRIEPDLLKKCHFIDFYGVANNHVMEHGAEAYKEMCNFLPTFCRGIFGSKEQKSILFKHEGKTITITGFSLRREEEKNAPLYWDIPNLSEIKEEYSKLNSDYKIAYVHWGVEFITYPSIDQRRFAHWLIDLGFDLVIGMHPHILQGYEEYNSKYIFYSLGNFIFNMAWEQTKYSIVVNVDVTKNNVTYDYIKIDTDLSPKFITENEVPENLRLKSLNKKVSTIRNPEEYISEANVGLKQYRKSSHKAFIKNLPKLKKGVVNEMIIDFIKRRFNHGNTK